jgi:hypothetical protein
LLVGFSWPHGLVVRFPWFVGLRQGAGHPVSEAVVVTPARFGLSPHRGSQKGVVSTQNRRWDSRRLVVGLPCSSQTRQPSDDGGGAHAGSAVPSPVCRRERGGGHFAASCSAPVRVARGDGGDGAAAVFWPSAPCLAHGERLQGLATCQGGEVVSGGCWQVGTHLHPVSFAVFHAVRLVLGVLVRVFGCFRCRVAFSGLSRGLYPVRMAVVVSPARSGYPLVVFVVFGIPQRPWRWYFRQVVLGSHLGDSGGGVHTISPWPTTPRCTRLGSG